MKHTEINLEAITRLAMLTLSDEEKESYHKDLCNLVDFCSCLCSFDAEKSSARSSFVPLEQLRADEPIENGDNLSENGEYLSIDVRVVSDEV